MGMFDSFFVKCPECGNELEFQSKSGVCALYNYKKSNLPPEVAVGIDGDIVRCQFCNNRIKLICKLPKNIKIILESLGKKNKFDYDGNYNSKHPQSIKNAKKLAEIISK